MGTESLSTDFCSLPGTGGFIFAAGSETSPQSCTISVFHHHINLLINLLPAIHSPHRMESDLLQMQK